MVNNQDAQLDAAFSALADPTRRAIVARLAHGQATVGELAAPFAMSAPAVSRHLRVLERAGLLERRIEGRVHRMALSPRPLEGVEQWLQFHREFWEPRLDALARWLEGTETEEEEVQAWRRPRSIPRRRSGSNARSPRRPSASSRRGRKPKG